MKNAEAGNQDFDQVDLEDGMGETFNVSQSDVDHINAELVRASQSNISQITANEVEVRSGVVMQASGENFIIRQSVVGATQADHSQLDKSNIGFVNAREASFTKCQTVAVYAKSVTLQDSGVNLLVTQQLNCGTIHSTICIAGKVEGTVETALDTRGAALLGLVAGATLGLVLFIGNVLFKKRR